MDPSDNYFYCSAKLRPHYCKVKTNVCCLRCDHNSSCQILAKTSTVTPRLVPCTSKHVSSNETCEFAI